MALNGHPRYTKDPDVWVEMTPENVINIIKSLEQFGFGSAGLKESDFLVPHDIEFTCRMTVKYAAWEKLYRMSLQNSMIQW